MDLECNPTYFEDIGISPGLLLGEQFQQRKEWLPAGKVLENNGMFKFDIYGCSRQWRSNIWWSRRWAPKATPPTFSRNRVNHLIDDLKTHDADEFGNSWAQCGASKDHPLRWPGSATKESSSFARIPCLAEKEWLICASRACRGAKHSGCHRIRSMSHIPLHVYWYIYIYIFMIHMVYICGLHSTWNNVWHMICLGYAPWSFPTCWLRPPPSRTVGGRWDRGSTGMGVSQ